MAVEVDVTLAAVGRELGRCRASAARALKGPAVVVRATGCGKPWLTVCQDKEGCMHFGRSVGCRQEQVALGSAVWAVSARLACDLHLRLATDVCQQLGCGVFTDGCCQASLLLQKRRAHGKLSVGQCMHCHCTVRGGHLACIPTASIGRRWVNHSHPNSTKTHPPVALA